MTACFCIEKTAPKTDKFFNFLPHTQRAGISVLHFSIEVDILIFCNILHLEMYF